MVEVVSNRRIITRAVLSTAGRRTALEDDVGVHKALIDIEGSSLIVHVLRKLHRGGITHIVLVVSYSGAAIIAEVEALCRDDLHALQVDYVDLGSDFDGFYAKSLLAAYNRGAFDSTEPGMLISTSDHIFDEALVADMCRVDLIPGSVEACALVDFSPSPFIGLPETAVGVRCLNGAPVVEISRALARPAVEGKRCLHGVGIEAGLFACTLRLFERLSDLAAQRDYFSLVDGIMELVNLDVVTALATKGRRWVAVETVAELAVSRRDPSLLSNVDSDSDSAGETPECMRGPVPAFFIAGGAG